MAAQLQGLLIALVLLGSGAGCASAPTEPPANDPASSGSAAAQPPAAGGGARAGQPEVRVAPATVPDLPGLGPEILLPVPGGSDDEVARVGDLVLRKSDAFTRLSSAHPNLALTAVDLLVFDVLVAGHAQAHGIRVDPARIEAIAAAEEASIRSQVGSEFGGELEFASYVWRIFGMRLADWQRTLRLRTAQRLYQGYVIRYLGLREDRVQVRFLAHKDEAVARDVADKVRAGADFATLALRWSEDASRRDGGLLPPFGKGFDHPVAAVAMELERGQVSAPFRARLGDSERWFVVYCLRRLVGREVPFAAVRDEIDADLASNPLSQLETAAYTLRWRNELERVAPPASTAKPANAK